MAQSESSESLPSSSSSNSHDTSVKSLQCNNRKQFTLPSIILPPSPTTNMLGKNRSDLNNHHQRKNYPIKSLSTFKFQPIPIKPTYEQIYDCIITENLIQLKKFILDSYGNQIYSWLNSNIVQISMNVKQFIESIPSIQVCSVVFLFVVVVVDQFSILSFLFLLLLNYRIEIEKKMYH